MQFASFRRQQGTLFVTKKHSAVRIALTSNGQILLKIYDIVNVWYFHSLFSADSPSESSAAGKEESAAYAR